MALGIPATRKAARLAELRKKAVTLMSNCESKETQADSGESKTEIDAEPTTKKDESGNEQKKRSLATRIKEMLSQRKAKLRSFLCARKESWLKHPYRTFSKPAYATILFILGGVVAAQTLVLSLEPSKLTCVITFFLQRIPLQPIALAIVLIIASGIAIVIFSIIYCWVVRKREIEAGFKMENIIKEVDPADQTDADAASPSLAADLSPETALSSFFLTASVTPQEVFTRISEKITADTRALRTEREISIKVPANLKNQPFVIPLFFHRRGAYPDSLNVKDCSDGTVTTLNLQQSFDYVGEVLKSVFPSSDAGLAKDIKTYIENADVITEDSIDERREELNKIEGRIDSLTEAPRDLKLAIKQFLELLFESYPICARCEAGRSNSQDTKSDAPGNNLQNFVNRSMAITASISYRIPLVHTRGNRKGPIGTYLSRPNTIFYNLGTADQTQSYHLQAVGPKDSYCSMLSLKSKLKEDEAGTEGQETAEQKDPGFPQAEKAYTQKRCGQRHLSLSIKNGHGFSSWYIVYRHTPRFPDAHQFSLIAASITTCLLWAHIVSIDSASSLGNTLSDGAIIAILTGVASFAVTWIVRENKSGGRGGEVGPAATAVLIVLATIVTCISLIFYETTYWLLQCAYMALFATTLLLSMRALTWYSIVLTFRKETESSLKLACKEPDGEGHKTWGPGWLAVDGNRHFAEHSKPELIEDGLKEYADNHRYVLKACKDAQRSAASSMKTPQARSPGRKRSKIWMWITRLRRKA